MKLALVGASGVVGRKILQILEKKKITFEEVLGTRRFTYERYPNNYNVKINSIYTNFL